MALENMADAYTDARADEERYDIEIWASRLTEKTIFEKPVIRRLRDTGDAITYGRIRRAVRNQAKKLGIRMADIDQHLKDCGVDKYNRKQEQSRVNGQDMITLTVPGKDGDTTYTRKLFDWRLENGKIVRYTEHGSITACKSKLLVIRKLKDRDDRSEAVEIAWKKPVDDVTQTQIVPRATVASKTEIIKLAGSGFPVSSGVAGALVDYIDDMTTYDTDIKTYESTAKMGWTDDLKAFVPYDKDVVFYNGAQTMLAQSIRTGGDSDKWMDLMRRIRSMGRTEPRLCMASAFAGPLVKLVDGQAGIVNLARETGLGKTVSMTCAASIYGYPAKGHLILDAASTSNFAESAMGTLRHFPVFFDDLSAVDKPQQNVPKLIYSICKEESRGRLNQDSSQKKTWTWQTIAQTNYERDLASLGLKGGAENRVYDFQCDDGAIFNAQTNPTAEEVMTTLLHNYGHAGETWIKWLKKADKGMLKQMVKDTKKKLEETAQVNGMGRKSGKQLSLLAIIMVADALSAKYIFEDGITLDPVRMLRDCKSEDDVLEPAKAYEKLGDIVLMNEANFYSVANGIDPVKSGKQCYGSIDCDTVSIIPTKMDEWANEHQFSVKQLCKWLLSKHPDLIETDKDRPGRLQKTVSSLTGPGKTGKGYRITLWQDIADDREETATGCEEPLPF